MARGKGFVACGSFVCAIIKNYKELWKSKDESKHLLVNPCLLSRSFGSQDSRGLSGALSLPQNTALQRTKYPAPTDTLTCCFFPQG